MLRHNHFSTRAQTEISSNPLFDAVASWRATGRRLLDLTQSNPTRAGLVPPVQDMLDGFSVASDAAPLFDYQPDPLGHLHTRKVVCGLAWGQSHADALAPHTVLTASTSEAYGFLFKLLCDGGDQILAPEPSYPLLEHLARLEAVTLVPYPLRFDGQWHIDIGELTRRITPLTRAIVVVNPNNPTGSYLKRQELDALLQLGLPIISDEVFASFSFEPDVNKINSVLASQQGLNFALSGLSKLAGMPQMKLGWITIGGSASNVQAALERLALISDTYLSVNTPIQHAVVKWEALIQRQTERIRMRCLHNLQFLQSQRRDTDPFDVLPAEGGWYAMVRLPSFFSDEQWCLALLDQCGVLVHPGFFYDVKGMTTMVIGLLVESDDFSRGIGQIFEYVRRCSA